MRGKASVSDRYPVSDHQTSTQPYIIKLEHHHKTTLHMDRHTLGLFTWERITFRKTFWNVIRPFLCFERLILAHVNAKLFQIRLSKHEKRGILDRDSRRKPDSRTCERKALSERDACVCTLEMRAEAMHGSISVDCTVGAKYYLTVRRSWSWLGRRLQCMWTHVVQITIPITFWIAIRNVFQNVIRSHVNTATYSCYMITLHFEKVRLGWNWKGEGGSPGTTRSLERFPTPKWIT